MYSEQEIEKLKSELGLSGHTIASKDTLRTLRIMKRLNDSYNEAERIINIGNKTPILKRRLIKNRRG